MDSAEIGTLLENKLDSLIFTASSANLGVNVLGDLKEAKSLFRAYTEALIEELSQTSTNKSVDSGIG